MVHRAQAHAEHLGLDALIRVMDAHALDLPGDAFDAALLHLILVVVPDPEAAIREVAHVLRPGSHVGVFDLNRRLGPLLDTSGLKLVREERSSSAASPKSPSSASPSPTPRPAMVELLDQTTGNVLGVRVSGTITGDDYECFRPVIDERVLAYRA